MEARPLHIAGVVALVLIAYPFVAHAIPQMMGADASYVVESGSMEPNISVGSVIWVTDVPAKSIKEGDVITFYTGPSSIPTTHRVIFKAGDGEDTRFVTKGDANEGRDAETRSMDEVVGKVTLVIPLMGYVIKFAQTDTGIVVMVIIPTVLFILNELWELYRASTQGRETNE